LTSNDNVGHTILGGLNLESAAVHISIELQTQWSGRIHTQANFTPAAIGGLTNTACFAPGGASIRGYDT
jgi:hypothetical protein